MLYICRTCGEDIQLSNAVHLFEPRQSVYVKQIKMITNLELVNLHELPAYMCSSCKQCLIQAIAFRDQCIDIQKKYDILVIATTVSALDKDPLETTLDNVIKLENTETMVERSTINENDAVAAVSERSFSSEEGEYVQKDLISDAESWNEPPHLQESEVANINIKTKSEHKTMRKKRKSLEESSVCDQCGKSFKSKSLELHLLRHTGVKAFECNLCKAKFYTEYYLKLHIRKRHCSERKREIEDKSLYATTVTVHPTAAISEQDSESNRLKNDDKDTVVGEIDQSIADDSGAAHKVKKYKTKPTSHNCHICGKKYKIRRDLQLHILRHTGKKNFECEYCQAKFYTQHLLKMHAVKHTEPFKCRYCEATFGYNNSRNRHERLHTNERPFECQYCDKRFVCSTSLKDHEVKHTGEMNYHCKICDIRFSMNKQLHAHTRSKAHKDMVLNQRKITPIVDT